MDRAFHDALRRGLGAFGLPVAAEALPLLERFADRLLAWNRKVNLTRITAPAEVAEKHLVDSLLLLPAVAGARTLLDVGSGAGLPGVPLACVRRDLEVTCCDSATRKIAFVKAVSAELDVRVRGLAVRAGGDPGREGLPRADAVVSRALAEPGEWVPLGVRYLAEGGVLLAMLGREADRPRLEEIGRRSGLALDSLESFVLPVSGSARAIARWRRA
ncbi:MAG TPA: 16S rRNA (guanine(527)-N(7))-methyltransferase RsmG [Anaeromyxobacter sp.]|nr:16S rRNA (guanine(527)-N(7))-methyltransferase RsmG [Anaeromyxobacter sp.]